MSSDQERPDERLRDRPGFDEWADEVVGAVEGRRSEQQGDDAATSAHGILPPEDKRRRRRRLPFLQRLFQRRG